MTTLLVPQGTDLAVSVPSPWIGYTGKFGIRNKISRNLF